jgi:hypothetical protein
MLAASFLSPDGVRCQTSGQPVDLQKIGLEFSPTRKLLVKGSVPPIGQTDRGGRLFVLDTQANLIDVYARDGAAVFSFPLDPPHSQQVVPKRFAITNQNVVGVIELYGRHVALFKAGGKGAVLIRRLEFPQNPSSICAVGKDLYVYLSESDGSVYRISSRGEASLAFKMETAKAAPPMQQYLHDVGLIGIESRRAIIAVQSMFPTVTAYSLKGERLWQTKLRGFKQIEISQINENQMILRPPASGYQTFFGGFSTGSVVALQLSLTLPPRISHPFALPMETRFLSIRDGREVASSNEIPGVLGVSSSMLIGYDLATGGFQRFRIAVHGTQTK